VPNTPTTIFNTAPQVYGKQPVDQRKFLLETPGAVEYTSPWIEFWAIIIGIILIILLAFMVIFFVWPNPTTDVKVVVIDRPQPENSTAGASSDGQVFISNASNFTDQTGCFASSTRTWSNGCACIPPFYGPQCDLESYDQDYVAIGTPDINTIIADIGDPTSVDRLSFPINIPMADDHPFFPVNTPDMTNQVLCTDLCDAKSDCQGVIWTPAPGNNAGIGAPPANKPTCQLITGSVTVSPGSNIPYSSTVQSTLYMKSGSEPSFKDRVFVYTGTRAVRYWLDTSYSDAFGDNRGQTMFERQLIKFNWTPTRVINTTGCQDSTSSCQFGNSWYGIFSNLSFDPSNDVLFRNIINQSIANSNTTISIDGQEYIVVAPGDRILSIPASWFELWGAFMPISVPSLPVTSASDTAQSYQTSLDSSIVNELESANQSISSLYRRRNLNTITDDINRSNIQTTHIISWDRLAFPLDGSGNSIDINVGDKIRFISNDVGFHDLVSTDSYWFTINTPFNVGTAKPFSTTLNFNNLGTYYVKDRINPLRIRQIINVR
jgi:hypothetical protein